MVYPMQTSITAGTLVENAAFANRAISNGTSPGSAAYGTLGISRSATPATPCVTTASAANCDYQLFFNQQRR
jgi:hypothetical protein